MNPPQMPFPFPFPPVVMQQGTELPPRVRAALEYLAYLSVKTRTNAAVNDMCIELIPGQKLSTSEVYAQGAACTMLASYFRNENDKDTPQGQEVPGVVLRCFVCSSGEETKSNCVLCKGSGHILVFPTSGGGR